MDRPEQISVVIVGDGESETGPTATAWQCVQPLLLSRYGGLHVHAALTLDSPYSSHKWLDPAESGAVLPILHVNGFKISERTLPGVRPTPSSTRARARGED